MKNSKISLNLKFSIVFIKNFKRHEEKRYIGDGNANLIVEIIIKNTRALRLKNFNFLLNKPNKIKDFAMYSMPVQQHTLQKKILK